MTLKAKLLDSRTDSLQWPVTLPSKGKFYQSYNPANGVRVRPIAFEDELAMSQRINDPNFNPVNFIIKTHTTGINVDELLMMDRFAILLAIRRISFGKDCKSSVFCPKCKTENVLKFDLEQFPINFVPDDYKDPRKVELPILGITAEVRFPRLGEIETLSIENIAKDLWRFVESIDGVEDKVQITEVLFDQRFPLKDSKVLLDSVLGGDFGVQTVATYECCNENCKSVNEARFEVGPDFLAFGT